MVPGSKKASVWVASVRISVAVEIVNSKRGDLHQIRRDHLAGPERTTLVLVPGDDTVGTPGQQIRITIPVEIGSNQDQRATGVLADDLRRTE